MSQGETGRIADTATVSYFDDHIHEYGVERIRGVAELLQKHSPPPQRSSLIDVGSGTGTNLRRLARQLGIPRKRVTAMDVSARSLEELSRALPKANVAEASILDDRDLADYKDRFDLAFMAAVLHHLVRGSRRGSRRDAQHGLRNALSLVKPGGVLIIMEPVFRPRAASWALFWVKRIVTQVTNTRVSVGHYWNNVGAPVVSFYTAQEVREMAIAAGGTIVAEQSTGQDLHTGWVNRVFQKENLTLIIRRPL